MKPPIAPPRPRVTAVVWALALITLASVAVALVGRCVAPESPCLWLHLGVLSAAALVGVRAGWLALPGASALPLAVQRPPPAIALAGVDASVRFHDDPATIPADAWEAIVPADAVFMDLAYLRGLGEAEHGPIEARYAILTRDERPIAAAYFQLLAIDPSRLGSDAAGWRLPVRLLIGLWRRTQTGPLRILVCGNALHSRTGAFQAGALRGREADDALAAVTEALLRQERRRGGVTLLMLKDLEDGDPDSHARLLARGYHPLPSAQPTMDLELAPTWRRFDDYLAAMSSKYRKRAKAARRKGGALTRVDLSEAAIGARAGELQALLDAVMARADFTLTSVTIAGLRRLKQSLGARLRFTAYEERGALVGFAAAILGPGRLEALFVGLDYEANQRLALYQNILYDFVDDALAAGLRGVHLGRSALEIKSTIGAAPVPLRIYLRHPSSLMNRAVKRALATTAPAPWIQRHPFRDDDPGDEG